MGGCRRACRVVLVAVIGVSAAAVLPGCVGYSAYPPVEGEIALSDPNMNHMRQPMTQALKWVIDKYPPGEYWEQDRVGTVAINLPVGVSPFVYRIVAEDIERAVPLTPETADLPTYHVSRIWVKGDTATVEVLRPVRGWASPDSTHQGVTVRLRGGMQPWHVTTHRLWAMGTLPVPDANFMPDPGRPGTGAELRAASFGDETPTTDRPADDAPGMVIEPARPAPGESVVEVPDTRP